MHKKRTWCRSPSLAAVQYTTWWASHSWPTRLSTCKHASIQRKWWLQAGNLALTCTLGHLQAHKTIAKAKTNGKQGPRAPLIPLTHTIEHLQARKHTTHKMIANEKINGEQGPRAPLIPLTHTFEHLQARKHTIKKVIANKKPGLDLHAWAPASIQDDCKCKNKWETRALWTSHSPSHMFEHLPAHKHTTNKMITNAKTNGKQGPNAPHIFLTHTCKHLQACKHTTHKRIAIAKIYGKNIWETRA